MCDRWVSVNGKQSKSWKGMRLTIIWEIWNKNEVILRKGK